MNTVRADARKQWQKTSESRRGWFFARAVLSVSLVCLLIVSVPATGFASTGLGADASADVLAATGDGGVAAENAVGNGDAAGEAGEAVGEDAASDASDTGVGTGTGSAGGAAAGDDAALVDDAPGNPLDSDTNASAADDADLAEEEAADTDSSLETLAQDAPLAAGTYFIRPAVSHTRVLDISGGSLANQANVQLWNANRTLAQRFKVSVKDGLYVIVNEGSKRALDVAWGAARIGANVQQYTQNNTKAQKWALKDNGDGSFTLVSALSSQFVLDVSGARNANGANIQLYRANNTAAQKFYFMPADPQVKSEKTTENGVYTITSALPNSLVLDIPAASDSSGARLQIYPKNDTVAQMFDIRLQDDGFYLIRSMCSGLALDVAVASPMATAAIQQYKSNGTDAQKWAIKKNDDGSVSFISKTSGLALDVVGAKSVLRTPLQQYYLNETAAGQKFYLTEVTLKPLGEGYMSITPYANTSLRVDIAGASRASGANVQAYSSNNTVAQKFEVQQVADSPYYTFRALASGLYLTQEGSNVCQRPAPTQGPAEAQQWSVEYVPGGMTIVNRETSQAMVFSSNDIRTARKSDASAQIFRFASAKIMEPGCYIISAATGLVLDVKGGSLASGANVQLYTRNNTGAQKWNLTLGSDGSYTIANAASKLALDIAKGSDVEGANVQQGGASSTAAQKWKLVPTGDGWFYLQAQNDTYLTAANGGTSNGANVFVSAVAAASNKTQKYTFTATTYGNYSGNANLDQKLQWIIDNKTGTSGDVLWKSFDYTSHSFRYISGSTYPTGDWSVPFAIEMVDRGGGNCYRFAALFCWLARAYGYDARVVSGSVPSISSGWAPHGWVEIYKDGQVYICDPDMENAYAGRGWYMTTYSQAPITYRKG
jgi:hypothetical protein